MKENYNNYDKNYDKAYNNKQKNSKQESVKSYSYYSRLLNKPFDTLLELEEAERVYQAAQRAKEDKAAQKKADAKKVEDAFKALNVARKEYKEKFTQLTTEYAKALENLKKAFDLGKKEIHDTLAAAEDNYSKALKEFTEKYESYHLTLKDGDFETTICSNRSATADKTPTVSSLFDLFFNF